MAGRFSIELYCDFVPIKSLLIKSTNLITILVENHSFVCYQHNSCYGQSKRYDINNKK